MHFTVFRYILVDPWLAPKDSFGCFASLPESMPFKACDSQKSFISMPICDLPKSVDEILSNVDYYIVTHIHPDHIDMNLDGTVGNPLDKKIPVLVQNEDDAQIFKNSGFANVQVLSENGLYINDIKITKVPALHGTNIPCGSAMGFVMQGNNIMKELNIMEATVFTSPNPLTLICSQNNDGTTNLAPICFVSYLSFNPPMIGFATGKQSHTGKRVRETGKAIVTIPSENLAQTVMAYGSSTGENTNKVEENHVDMMPIQDSTIQIPVDTRLAMIATLKQSLEVGDHILHICQVDKFLGDESKKGLYAWNGFSKVATAIEG